MHDRTHAPALPRAFASGQLRRFRPNDLAAFQTYRSIAQLGLYQGWAVMTDAQASAFIEDMSAAPLFPLDDWIQLAIADLSGELLLGDIGLYQSADGQFGEIGFTLDLAAQHRGIATQAVHEAIELFFGLTQATQIHGVTDQRNSASVRLLKRLGFELLEQRLTIFRGERCTEEVYILKRYDSKRL